MNGLLTIKETASLLRLTIETVRKLCVKGELPARKVGHVWRIDRDRLLASIGGGDNAEAYDKPNREQLPSPDAPPG